jgi:hypothetical protein
MIEKAVYHGTIKALKDNDTTKKMATEIGTLSSQRKHGIRNKEIRLKHNKSISCQRPIVNKNKNILPYQIMLTSAQNF